MTGKKLFERAVALNISGTFPYADCIRAEAAFFYALAGIREVEIPKTIVRPSETASAVFDGVMNQVFMFYGGVMVGQAKPFTPGQLRTALESMEQDKTKEIVLGLIA